MYQIKDLQFPGENRLFADGAKYKTKEDVRLQLIDYHEVDWEEALDINSLSLREILEYGDWEVVKVGE